MPQSNKKKTRLWFRIICNIWVNIIYLVVGSIFWYCIFKVYNFCINNENIAKITSDFIAAFSTGLLGYYIFGCFSKILAIYDFDTQDIRKVQDLETRNLKFLVTNLLFNRNVNIFIYILPFIYFFFIHILGSEILLNRNTFLVSLIMGVWVAIGFNSFMLNKICSILFINNSNNHEA